MQNPEASLKAENKVLIGNIQKLIELPQNEEPEIRTVANINDVLDQPFFAGAKNGDKVLVYAQAKKAFLYRPSANKLINVAPVSLPTSTTGTASANMVPSPTAATQSVRFFLYNGTTTVGLTNKYEIALKSAILNAAVVDRDNAKKNDYAKTILVDIANIKPEVSAQVSKTLGIPLEKLPEGETLPQIPADFLIIVGADKQTL